jgi:hypothetical protein
MQCKFCGDSAAEFRCTRVVWAELQVPGKHVRVGDRIVRNHRYLGRLVCEVRAIEKADFLRNATLITIYCEQTKEETVTTALAQQAIKVERQQACANACCYRHVQQPDDGITYCQEHKADIKQPILEGAVAYQTAGSNDRQGDPGGRGLRGQKRGIRDRSGLPPQHHPVGIP